MNIELIYGDCLEVMKKISDNSIDLILTDPPYGTTACKWDIIIPLKPMWEQLKRIIKNNGAIVFTASQPFTSVLITSNIKDFKYCLVWDKVNKYTGALNANKMPLRRHEDIVIFYKKLPVYNKQMRPGAPYISTQTKGHGSHTDHGNSGGHITVNKGGRNPCSIIRIPADCKTELGLQNTQKPVALMEYFIKTYTNENDLVLDFAMGSGTTGAACKNLNRNFIGIEDNEKHYNTAKNRLSKKERIKA